MAADFFWSKGPLDECEAIANAYGLYCGGRAGKKARQEWYGREGIMRAAPMSRSIPLQAKASRLINPC